MRGSAAVPPSGVVLDVEQTIGPDAARTHIRLPFLLDREPEGIEVSFSYEPVVLGDKRRTRELIEAGLRTYGELAPGDTSGMVLRSLLTLSLDGPSGFRGCAHRYALSGPVLLTTAQATPGFIPGRIEQGRWQATISVHSVVTERCRFTLRVRTI